MLWLMLCLFGYSLSMMDEKILGFVQLKEYYKDDHDFANEFPKPLKDYVELEGYFTWVKRCAIKGGFVNYW